MEEALQLRKLRKKLRQIEALELLPRDLTPSEALKVSRRQELRGLVEELLSREGSGDVVQSCRVEPNVSPDPPKIAPPSTAKQRAPPPGPQVVVKTPDPHPLRGRRFLLHGLEGHGDLVTSVVLHDAHIISGSWDTTVRIWDMASGTEVRTLCGHTDAVTCLAIIPPGETLLDSGPLPPHQPLLSSGSSDSNIKVWSLMTGQPLLSIYTFSAVSALLPIPDHGLLISGSDGGKIDVWKLETQQNLCSERAHEEKVTALQLQAGLLYSGSADGLLRVWRASSSGGLSLLHSCDSLAPSLGGLSSICVTAGRRVYVANRGASLKVVDWRQDGLTRLANHTSGSGFVDAIAVTPHGLLVTSGFNVDQGRGFLNVRDVETGSYLGTLSPPDASRLLCLALTHSQDGLARWVTGGRKLLLWEELPEGVSLDSSAVTVQFCHDFLHPAPESDSEEEEEEELWAPEEEEAEPGVSPARGWCLLM